MENAKWLVEVYTDKYRSLQQAIMINLDMPGEEKNFQRSRVNPNLTILIREDYYDKDMKLLKSEQLNDNWHFEEIE